MEDIKKDIGVKDRSITSVKEKKLKIFSSPYGVVKAETKEEAEKKIIKLKEKATGRDLSGSKKGGKKTL